MILVLFTWWHGYSHPNKNKLVDIQEFLLLINVTIMYAVSYQGSDSVFSIATNVMISLAFIQFCTIVVYHFLTYTCHCNVVIALYNTKHMLIQFCNKKHLKDDSNDIESLNIPERLYDYAEYQQDGLVTDETNWLNTHTNIDQCS